jgi:glycosyltransferase involved in cell wall biosynthesis
MSTKTVSIVIPAYNEKAYLPAALESMHRQVKAMNRQVELLLIDNNSTDDTSRIAREFGATVIEERRQGYVYAVARGLQCAHGDIVIVTDADVVVAEDWLARIMDAFEDPCIAMVSGSLFMKGASPILDAVTYHVYTLFLRLHFAIGRPHVSGACFAVTRRALELCGPIDTRYAIGLDVHLGLIMQRYGRVVLREDIRITTSNRRFSKGPLKELKKYVGAYFAVVWLGIPYTRSLSAPR